MFCSKIKNREDKTEIRKHDAAELRKQKRSKERKKGDGYTTLIKYDLWDASLIFAFNGSNDPGDIARDLRFQAPEDGFIVALIAVLDEIILSVTCIYTQKGKALPAKFLGEG
jgi:hypothetical protein